LADGAWSGRAVNAVGRRRKIDPDEPDRIVRPRLHREGMLRLDSLEGEFRIVVVVRIVGDARDLERAARRRLLGAADRGGKIRDQRAVTIECAYRPPTLVDLDAGCRPRALAVAAARIAARLARAAERDDVGDDDPRTMPLEVGGWIEPLQQVLAHMEFFRQR